MDLVLQEREKKDKNCGNILTISTISTMVLRDGWLGENPGTAKKGGGSDPCQDFLVDLSQCTEANFE